jgi:alkylhydroperoxidase family enzyme
MSDRTPDPPFIDWFEDEEAEGDLAEAYRAYLASSPGKKRVPGILKCFSQRPDFLRQVVEFSGTVHFTDGHLDRRTKEMIATHVSALNRCRY